MESNTYIDINNREEDYKFIEKETFRAESGLRAISLMYDDHSNDKNSYENILKLKDNIHYRLFAATHQYLVFLRELNYAESYLQEVFQKNPNYLNGFLDRNPFFEKVEQELSSVFDNIVFQVSSIFDYLSHIICYIIFKNKNNTLYWTKLAKASRGKNNEFSNDELKKIVDIIDRRFVGKLYDYRSRLLHNYRDKHSFSAKAKLENFQFFIRILPSDIALKHFKLVKESLHKDSNITLTYLSSWLIKHTFIEIEEILDVLSLEIKKNSHFHNNIINPKRGKNSLVFVSANPENNTFEPISEGFWKTYKQNL